MKTAIATLESTSPYSQSRYVKVPKLDKESASLTPEQRITHNARMTVYTMVAEATATSSLARVDRAVKDSNSALPAARAAIAALGASIV